MNNVMYKDNNLVVWGSDFDGGVMVGHVDRGVSLRFTAQGWADYLSKLIVIAYNYGVGLKQGFNQVYGNPN